MSEQVDAAIRGRKTRKVLDGAGPDPARFRALVDECIALAGWAPFHFARTEEVPEPWRFVVVYGDALAEVGRRMGDRLLGKLPRIFQGAGCMIHATWIPETDPALAQRRDWEHAAAAAAAVQTLLIAAEARGLGSYWCSASPLNEEACTQALGIPDNERWLGSLFLGVPLPDDREATEGYAGKWRDKRTPPSAWSRTLSL